MNPTVKKAIRSLVPPALVNLIKGRPRYGFFGDYPDWQTAVQASSGYDDPEILEKVRTAVVAVKQGRAAYERDSVLFERPEYEWPLLACLLKIAAENGGSLSVLDFGGALGSSYFQCRDILKGLKALEWSIVEQKHFVADGKKHVEEGPLRFYFDIEACLVERNPDVVLLSCVLPYLPRPYEFLDQLLDRGFRHVLLDRTPLIDGNRDRLTIQKVPPSIYQAVYPAWFFAEDKFLRFFHGRYAMIAEFAGRDKVNIDAEYKGILFQRI